LNLSDAIDAEVRIKLHKNLCDAEVRIKVIPVYNNDDSSFLLIPCGGLEQAKREASDPTK
jgi:hypothetical protein